MRQALEIGLVSEVAREGDVEDRANELASTLASGVPLAQSIVERAKDRSSSMSFEQSLSFEEQAQAILLGSEDLFEGAATFIEKRGPEFKGASGLIAPVARLRLAYPLPIVRRRCIPGATFLQSLWHMNRSVARKENDMYAVVITFRSEAAPGALARAKR